MTIKTMTLQTVSFNRLCVLARQQARHAAAGNIHAPARFQQAVNELFRRKPALRHKLAWAKIEEARGWSWSAKASIDADSTKLEYQQKGYALEHALTYLEGGKCGTITFGWTGDTRPISDGVALGLGFRNSLTGRVILLHKATDREGAKQMILALPPFYSRPRS